MGGIAVSERIKVLIQMRYTNQFRNALTTTTFSTTTVPSIDIPDLLIDKNYLVKVPKPTKRKSVGDMEVGRLFTFDARPEVSTYLIRGEIEDKASLDRLTKKVEQDPNTVAIHSGYGRFKCLSCNHGFGDKYELPAK